MAEALSLVEHGWRGARACSLVLGRRGDRVLHLVKGTLRSDVRGLIAPVPGVRVRDVSRSAFRVEMWFWLLVGGVRRARWVLVDNARTGRTIARWCRLLRLSLVQVDEQADGDVLWCDGRRVTAQEAFGESWDGLTTSSSK